jgi:molybdate transport system ATP-binding protein
LNVAEGGLALTLAHRRGPLALEMELEVAQGETVALMGPSGAGKTTCLELVAGLLRPQTGRVSCGSTVWFDGAAGDDMAPEARRVGLLFQDYALFPHLDARANVAYGPHARGASRAEAGRQAEAWLERLGLREVASRRPRSLSGGERQRVALARALASGARALLLDEPMGALDVATRAAVRGQLRRVLAEAGLPVLLVTHDAVDALALGDRVAVLEGGRLTQVGTHDALALHPRTPFVAELAGRNLYPVAVAAGPGLKEARAGALVFHVLADAVEGRAFLVFAPSEVTLSAERHPGSAQNVFPATVREVRAAGDRVFAVLEVSGLTMTAEVTRPAAAALALGPGQRVWAAVKATAIGVYS